MADARAVKYCRRFGFRRFSLSPLWPCLLSPFRHVAALTFAVLFCRRFDCEPCTDYHRKTIHVQGTFHRRIRRSLETTTRPRLLSTCSSLLQQPLGWCGKEDNGQAAACPQCCGPDCLQHTQVGSVGSVVERRSLAGGLSLSCARPAANWRPLTWLNHPLLVNQPSQLSLSSFRGR